MGAGKGANWPGAWGLRGPWLYDCLQLSPELAPDPGDGRVYYFGVESGQKTGGKVSRSRSQASRETGLFRGQRFRGSRGWGWGASGTRWPESRK